MKGSDTTKEEELISILRKDILSNRIDQVVQKYIRFRNPTGESSTWCFFSPEREKFIVEYVLNETPAALIDYPKEDLDLIRIDCVIHNWFGNIRFDGNIPHEYKLSPRGVANTLIAGAYNAYHRSELRSCITEGLQYNIEIQTCSDDHVCEHCAQLAEHRYKIDDMPELPSPLCTREDGCRCWYALDIY